MLDELLLGGEVQETSKKNVLKAMASSSNEHHGRLAKFFISTGLDVSTSEDFEDRDHEE